MNVIGNFTNYDGEQVSDFDYSDGGDPRSSGFAGWQTDQDTVSFEATLTSNGDGPIDWMVGYYYFDMESSWTWMDVIDGSREGASPCPSDHRLWLQGTLILKISQRSRHTRMPKSGTMDRVYHLLC